MILCERGIRTFETATRNTLDLSAVPVVKKLSHLPIIVDPSHGTGLRDKVSPMALAAVAAGADGITVEVHTDPDHALSDGPQTLYPEQFEKLMRDIEALAPVLGKELARLPDVEKSRDRGGVRHAAGTTVVVGEPAHGRDCSRSRRPDRRGVPGREGRVRRARHPPLVQRGGAARSPCRSSGPCSTRCCRARRASAWCPSRTP